MNIDGVWIALGWLVIASAFLWWIWTSAEAEIPNGVTITHNSHWGWNYTLDDPRAMSGTGYLTRNAAIRAANAELDRLHEKDQATQ